MPSTSKSVFTAIHQRLRAIMRKFQREGLRAKPDKPGNYCLVGPPVEMTRGRDMWFGAVKTGKAYVSYHLIAVYAFPELLKGMSPELRRRMQGKSCFNFKAADPKLFRELAQLTDRSYRRLRRAGFLP
ncbi:MAG: hypothetical protein ACREN5_04730 [Gemmatimonadales bacterium]